MIDGIIQEVNQKIKSMIDWRCKSLTPHDLETWLNLYQQELIEKIKQESDVYQSEISDYKDAISLEKLIGENQK